MPACPDGHDSTSTDYCDVCGRQISADPLSATTSTPLAGVGTEPCPACGEPRTGRFCEGCSYDFVAAQPVTATPPAPPPVDPPIDCHTGGEPTGPPAAEWTAVVRADRAYFDAVREQDGPDAATISFPTYCPNRVFSLTGQEIRIGRRSRSQGVTPEIDLSGPPQDPGISHLHAVLLARPDGGWMLLDPGSTNGTTVNADQEPVPNDTAIPVHDGDEIHLGAWTTLTLRAGDR
ncbi:FHA domain-containing protein [Solihabitans fulvus]|uniref:FHA domain-containing protein n=1 Tax=Solihabitans fulvus TaxID=1892852 RepID=A0A5B2WX25_9PSEU|nr:FHA domain-containing protein [Solihabitans fulvus]KAA2255212.1 FHA domain-containing protein [Solihabitans fulvus]